MFVCKLQVGDLLDKIDFAVQDDEPDMLLELFEVREAIEVKAAQLAALRRTEKELEEMQEAIWDMERDLRLSRDASSSSFRFHVAIIKASHNSVLYRIHDSLSDLLTLSRKKSLGVQGRQGVALAFHKRMFEEICERNPEAAGSLMLAHLQHASLPLKI